MNVKRADGPRAAVRPGMRRSCRRVMSESTAAAVGLVVALVLVLVLVLVVVVVVVVVLVVVVVEEEVGVDGNEAEPSCGHRAPGVATAAMR